LEAVVVFIQEVQYVEEIEELVGAGCADDLTRDVEECIRQSVTLDVIGYGVVHLVHDLEPMTVWYCKTGSEISLLSIRAG
jgi:hypothetical protein